MDSLYCIYCSMAFLNSASRINIRHTDGSVEWIDQRGYQTVREIAKKVADDPGAYMEINNSVVHSKMRVEAMVDGSGVCMDHVYEAVETWRYRRGRP